MNGISWVVSTGDWIACIYGSKEIQVFQIIPFFINCPMFWIRLKITCPFIFKTTLNKHMGLNELNQIEYRQAWNLTPIKFKLKTLLWPELYKLIDTFQTYLTWLEIVTNKYWIAIEIHLSLLPWLDFVSLCKYE